MILSSPLVIIIPIIVVVVILLLTGYVKASPDEALIISGMHKDSRVVTGRAAIKLPFFERKDRLSLKIIKIDVKTKEAVPTNEFINVNVDAVVTAKISSDPELIKIAAENFLNQGEEYIVDMICDVLEGNIREIIGTMTLESMISNRQEFAKRVQENAVPDMKRMGIEIVSFNVQNFSDRNGIIEDLGIDNTTKIKKNASIVKAESERDVKIAQAKADKEANDAEIASQQEIAIKQNDLAIKKAELQKISDVKKAEADAAYKIQEEEQRKTIEISTANANLARQEKEIELKSREVEITEKSLEAQIKKKAEAEKYQALQRADAILYEKEREAEAEKYAIEQEALSLKAKAEAEKFAKLQEAEGIKAKALAEAEGIKAKALAEAEGIDKKAEAMQKMHEAAILEMYFKVLPDIAASIAKPLENIDKITMYGEGNTTRLIGDITKTMTQVSDGIGDSLGVDLKSMLAGLIGGKIATSGKDTGINPDDVSKMLSAVASASSETTEIVKSESPVETLKPYIPDEKRSGNRRNNDIKGKTDK